MAIKTTIKSLLSRIGGLSRLFDVRDCFVFGGLVLVGYGLWLLAPWAGFAVPGAIMLLIGLFVGKRPTQGGR